MPADDPWGGGLSSRATLSVSSVTFASRVPSAPEPTSAKCVGCEYPLSFYVQPMSGYLVSWCVMCRIELIVPRRRI